MISKHISDDIPPIIKILNMVIPILMFPLKLKHCKSHKAARHPTECYLINDFKLFPTVYHRIYHCKFLTLSNQTSRYKSKCIRMAILSESDMHNIPLSDPVFSTLSLSHQNEWTTYTYLDVYLLIFQNWLLDGGLYTAVLCLGQDFWGTPVSPYLNYRGTFAISGGHTNSI